MLTSDLKILAQLMILLSQILQSSRTSAMDLQALIFYVCGFFFCVGVGYIAVVRNSVTGRQESLWALCCQGELTLIRVALELSPLPRLMLEQPLIELNLARDDGFTALHLAVYCGNGEALKALLKHTSISVNLVRAGSGLTALHMAACQGRGEALKLLLAE